MKPTAKKATPTKPPGWLRLDCGIEQVLLFAPAEVAVRWGGSTGGSKVRITFTYWQDIVGSLPDKLRPTAGSVQTPHLTVGSADEAAALVEQLRLFVLARHPKMKVKKQKSLTRFLYDAEGSYWLTVEPESEAEVAGDAGGTSDAWTWPVGDDRVLLWRVTNHWDGVRVRVTPDEILCVDSEAADDELAGLVGGKPTGHGTWTCKQLLTGMWMWLAVTDLRGIETAKVSALQPFAGKAVKPRSSDAIGGAIVVPATGQFRAETGGDKQARWLRFVRAS